MFSDSCKIENKLDQIHEWTHYCLNGLNHDKLCEAHQLGNEILEMLNKRGADNGVKFIALFEALSVGADQMQIRLQTVSSTTVN